MCPSISPFSFPILSPSFQWKWYSEDGRHERIQHLHSFCVCCVVWRSRTSHETLRRLNLCQILWHLGHLFSHGLVSFLHPGYEKDLPHLRNWSKWLYQCLLGDRILPWSVLSRGTMKPIGGNECALGELNWTWYSFPCFINHLKFYSKLWGEKRWKRKVSKEAVAKAATV